MAFILRGGDTWSSSNFGATWKWSGTTTNPIYIGVDQAWYSGSAWSRPIWTCGGSSVCSSDTGAYLGLGGTSNVIVDNIEVTGLFIPATQTHSYAYFAGCGLNEVYENIYAHGWVYHGTTNATQTVALWNTNGGCGKPFTIRYTVSDGIDSTQNIGLAVYPAAPIYYGNYVRYMPTGVDGCGDNWHDNVFEYMTTTVLAAHQDGFQHNGGCFSTSGPSLIYNNVLRHFTLSQFGGAGHYWINGLGPGGQGQTYFFNNIEYDTTYGNNVNTGGHAIQNYGTIYFFNNTIQCGWDSQMAQCVVGSNTGATLNMLLTDNHWIQGTTATPLSCTNNPGGTCSQTNDLMQTLAQANEQGYSETSAYAFQPTSASGATLTATASAATATATAATRQSLCTTIGAVDVAAGAACQSDSTYACAYDTTNHTVRCPARQTVARAAEPNIGAYQFSSAQASIPNPPTGLTVSVQ
jgi:hypothetical protein